MPLKWHQCSGCQGERRRAKIASVVVEDEREQSAEMRVISCKTQVTRESNFTAALKEASHRRREHRNRRVKRLEDKYMTSHL